VIETAEQFFGLLTLLCWAFLVACWGSVVRCHLGPRAEVLDRARTAGRDAAPWLAVVVSVTTMAGSLFFSEYAHYVPCLMCWVQRSLLYPLALLSLVLLVRPGWRWVRWLAIALAVADVPVSAYHRLIELHPSREGDIDCSAVGPACTVPYLTVFGSITLAVMALTSALTMVTLLLAARPDRT